MKKINLFSIVCLFILFILQSCSDKADYPDKDQDLHSKTFNIKDTEGNTAIVKVSSVNPQLIENFSQSKLKLVTTQTAYDQSFSDTDKLNALSSHSENNQYKNKDNEILIDLLDIDLINTKNGFRIDVNDDELAERYVYFYSLGYKANINALKYNLLYKTDSTAYHNLILQARQYSHSTWRTLKSGTTFFPGDVFSHHDKTNSYSYSFGVQHIGPGIIGFNYFWYKI